MKKMMVVSALALLAMAACAHKPPPPAARTTLAPTAGSTAQGTVFFQQLEGGSVLVKANLTGVPAGTHGFHVHERGACGDNGAAAGGHFNPNGSPHAGPEHPIRHAGDFGNVVADEKGEVHVTFTTDALTVVDGPTSVVGRAVILHAKADDLLTQPSGNAGARIACGVVEIVPVEMKH